MAVVQVQIPAEVNQLIDVVSERWGYWFAKRLTQSDMMKATTTERKVVTKVNKDIKKKIADYIDNGKNVRAQVQTLQGELKTAKAELKEKSSPFHDKNRPLIKAIAFLDREVIPEKLEKVKGVKVTPVFNVSESTLKALEKPKKSDAKKVD